MMKVHELINVLHGYDKDAEIYLEIEDTNSSNSFVSNLEEENISYAFIRGKKELYFVHKFPIS
jgi:hypothetical protein